MCFNYGFITFALLANISYFIVLVNSYDLSSPTHTHTLCNLLSWIKVRVNEKSFVGWETIARALCWWYKLRFITSPESFNTRCKAFDLSAHIALNFLDFIQIFRPMISLNAMPADSSSVLPSAHSKLNYHITPASHDGFRRMTSGTRCLCEWLCVCEQFLIGKISNHFHRTDESYD